MKRLSKAKRAQAEQHLAMAIEFEDFFWHSWCSLEEILGIEMDETTDLENSTIDDLLNKAGKKTA